MMSSTTENQIEISKLHEENSKLHEFVEKLYHKLCVLEYTCSQLQRDVRIWENRKESIKRRLMGFNYGPSCYINDESVLTTSSPTKRINIYKKKIKLSELREENTKFRERVEKLQDRVDRFVDYKKDFREKISRLRGAVDEYQKRI